ncbi:hypothetical protein PCE1_003090 [Barthelona sp. PCE]
MFMKTPGAKAESRNPFFPSPENSINNFINTPNAFSPEVRKFQPIEQVMNTLLKDGDDAIEQQSMILDQSDPEDTDVLTNMLSSSGNITETSETGKIFEPIVRDLNKTVFQDFWKNSPETSNPFSFKESGQYEHSDDLLTVYSRKSSASTIMSTSSSFYPSVRFPSSSSVSIHGPIPTVTKVPKNQTRIKTKAFRHNIKQIVESFKCVFRNDMLMNLISWSPFSFSFSVIEEIILAIINHHDLSHENDLHITALNNCVRILSKRLLELSLSFVSYDFYKRIYLMNYEASYSTFDFDSVYALSGFYNNENNFSMSLRISIAALAHAKALGLHTVNEYWKLVLSTAITESYLGLNGAATEDFNDATKHDISFAPSYQGSAGAYEVNCYFDRGLAVVQEGIAQNNRYSIFFHQELRLKQLLDPFIRVDEILQYYSHVSQLMPFDKLPKYLVEISDSIIKSSFLNHYERRNTLKSSNFHLLKAMSLNEKLIDSYEGKVEYRIILQQAKLCFLKYFLGGPVSALQDYCRRIRNAFDSSQRRSRSVVLTAIVRDLEEIGNHQQTALILHTSFLTSSSKWKAALSLSLFLLRRKLYRECAHFLVTVLFGYPASGRLWSILVQVFNCPELTIDDLREFTETKLDFNTVIAKLNDKKPAFTQDLIHHVLSTFDITNVKEIESPIPANVLLKLSLSTNSQDLHLPLNFRLFIDASSQVPKSGEVWCEGARILLNPSSPLYDPNRALELLTWSISFTPQYGDSFLEAIKAIFLIKTYPSVHIDRLLRRCIMVQPSYGLLWSFSRGHKKEVCTQTFIRFMRLMEDELKEYSLHYTPGCVISEEDRNRYSLCCNTALLRFNLVSTDATLAEHDYIQPLDPEIVRLL